MNYNKRKKVTVWLSIIALVLHSFNLYGNDTHSDVFLEQIDQPAQTTSSMYMFNTAISTSSAIVINGSFDDGLNGWSEPTYGISGSHFKLNTIEGYQGGNCAQLITGDRAIQQKLTGLEPYSAYVLKVWARLGNSATGAIEIGCENNGSTKKTITTTSKTYTQLEVSFVTGNRSTADIYAYIPAGTTEAYVDSFEVIATSLPTVDAGTITINPAEQYQTFDGWGTSLVWFGNAIGGWSEANRKAISDLVFDAEKGLGFNIIRYNIGGGDAPGHNHMRPGAMVPGFATGFDGNGKLIYDWTADANQIKMLKDALERNVTITEAFSNSPPYFMTVSGCSSGSVNKTSNNLKDEYYEEFADYLTEVVKHFRDNENITFDYLEPLNEPDTGYWGAYGGQEGCHFDPIKQEEIIQLSNQYLKDKNLTGTVVSAMDESVLDTGLKNFISFSQETKDSMEKWNVHTYGGSQRRESKNAAAVAGKDLWMSEVDLGGSGSYNPESIIPGIEFAKRVTLDVRNIQPTAWVIWQAVENWPNMMPSAENSNWGLVLANFEGEGAGGLDAEAFRTTKKYYAMMQYSKFIKPGSVMLGTPDDNMLAFYNKADSQLVYVVINEVPAQNKKISFDLRGFDSLGSLAKVYRTSKSQDCEKTTDVIINNGILTDEIGANSINTYIIDDVEYSDEVIRLNESTVSKTATGNRFEYSGTWGYYGNDSGDYTNDNMWSTNDTSTARLYFTGKQVKIYAPKANNHGIAKISIDGGEPILVDLYSSSRKGRSLIYESPVLEHREHVVLIEATGTKNPLSAGTPITIDYADIYSDKQAPIITITAITDTEVTTKLGIAPILQGEVDVVYSDGSTGQLPVTWDAVTADKYSQTGSFIVEGAVAGTAIKAKTTVTVKDDIIIPAITITAITEQQATTKVGMAPLLVTKVQVTYSDTTTEQLPVTWDSVTADKYSQTGSFIVEGVVAGTAIKAKTTVVVEAVNSSESNSGSRGSGSGNVTPVPTPVLTDTGKTQDTPKANIVQISLFIASGEASRLGQNIQLSVKPYIQDGRTMGGVRDIANLLQIDNENVVWNAKDKTVVINTKGSIVQLKINQKYAIVNGTKVDLDVAPQIKEGRTVLPIANIARILGIKVEFDEKSKVVIFSIEK